MPSNSLSLFPKDIFSKIHSDQPVRLVNEVIDKLNIEPIIRKYKRETSPKPHAESLNRPIVV